MELRTKGEVPKTIAEILNIDKQAVYYALKQVGPIIVADKSKLARRKSAPSKAAQAAKVKELRATGVPDRQIAAEMGLSERYVRLLGGPKGNHKGMRTEVVRGQHDVGSVVGCLTLVRDAEVRMAKHRVWECRCTCGNLVHISSYDLAARARRNTLTCARLKHVGDD